jgi:hypothetical protein
VWGDNVDDGELAFRFANEERAGLGIPLPLGGMNLFQETRFGPQLLGPAAIRDKAVGEDVEIQVNDDARDGGVNFDLDEIGTHPRDEEHWTRQELTVENENDYPVTVEVEFYDTDDDKITKLSQRTFRRDGVRVWRVVVPPEGERKLQFTSTEIPDPDWDL